MSVSFIEFLRKFCVYDEIFDKVHIMLGIRVIKFERVKFYVQIRKTGLFRLGHILVVLANRSECTYI